MHFSRAGATYMERPALQAALNFRGRQIQRNSLMRINYDEACWRAKIIVIIIKTTLHSKQIVSFLFRIRDWEKAVTNNMHDSNWCMLGVKHNALKNVPFGFLSISFSTLKVKIKLLIINFTNWIRPCINVINVNLQMSREVKLLAL